MANGRGVSDEDIINANDIRTNPNTPIKGHGLIKDTEILKSYKNQ